MIYETPLTDAEITDRIIKAFYTARSQARKKGATKPAELIKILRPELETAGFQVVQPVKTPMRYGRQEIGQYQIDLVVAGKYAIVIKYAKKVPVSERDRLRGAIRSQGLTLGLIFNFGYTQQPILRVDPDGYNRNR